MSLRIIPAGEFEMGTADEDVAALPADANWFFADFVPDRRRAETPRHTVTISKPFDALPDEVKDRVLRRLFDVVAGKDESATFAHLTASERRAILEIIRETKPGLPSYWHQDST